MQPILSAEDAGRYLDGLIDRERLPDRARGRLGLGPIRALLAAVGHPEAQLSVLHVAGSKGKGSVCLAAEALLQALGECTGTFTSPHLERWTERFRIDGEEIAGAALARAVSQLRPHVDRLREEHPTDAPSFFDATTAAALLAFARARVDRVVLEVGLGGRLDSTNAVTPSVTCITSIELEHTSVLGDTLAEIAGEKAGILEPGVPAVVGRLEPEARDVVRARARQLGTPLWEEGDAFRIDASARGRDGTTLRYAEPAGFSIELPLRLVGVHQARNVGLAIGCLRALGAHGDAALADAARRALPQLVLPGRIEVIGRDPWVVIDSAHTAASARALAEALRALGLRDLELVLSVSAGKDLEAILHALAPLARRITATRADPHRSLAPRSIERAARACAAAAGVSVRVVPNPQLAVRAAREAIAEDGALCVTGSVYLAGVARSVLRRPGAVRVSRRGDGAPSGTRP